MNKFEILDLNPNLPKTSEEIEKRASGNFIKYLELVLEDYINTGWKIVAPNIITNPYGSIIKAIFIFEKKE